MKLDEAVRHYNTLKEQIKDMEERHKQEIAPLKAKKEAAEAAFLQYLRHLGAEHTATKYGTVYERTSSRASVADWQAVLAYIEQTSDTDILEARVNASAIKERLDDGIVVPGVNFHQHVSASVRRK